ncbi:MAG TPA: AAA-like domain-containing protein [Bacillota bacterium]|nr:AAA-like domain-containing protein [Bacillota bacterium]
MTNPATSFYKTGGTLDYNHPSYIERAADQELYQQLKQGEYCYILTSRQMGKSSLMVRTALRLRQEGESVVTIDLTSFGNTLEQEQWYDSLANRIGQQLHLENELEDFWFGHERLSPFQRWMEALRQVVLPKCPGRLILFIDEIDIVRSFKFSADEFFAGIRECYNRRAEAPEMNRLVFCLLGVLSPSELIQDADITPFNIGQRIELTDFSMEESALLMKGLNRKQPLAVKLIERIIDWTGGHPYLTQSLCAAVERDAQVQSPDAVDLLCRKLFLASGATEKENNLVFVQERLLQSKLDQAELLNLYQKILGGQKIPDDDANPFTTVLKLAGLVKSTAGILQVRNRIYQKVFNRVWISDNMPDAELQRQKAAYRRGVIRTAVIAFTAFMMIGAGIYWYYYTNIQVHIEYYSAIIKRWGAFEGFSRVPARDISKRIHTYKFYRQGGKVIKFQEVNCYGQPTTFTRVGTYFGQSLESTNDTCQIEYIYDRNGQIIYEKYLDRSGQFVGGFVYSPAVAKLSRRAFYVDKNGYHKTWGKAEYVNITWSKEGDDRRIQYVDRYGNPQPGKYNEYGVQMTYNSYGLPTRTVSLDAHGRPMIDGNGKAIVETIYDQLDEGHQAFNWFHVKNSHGNIVENRLLDVSGKLVLGKEGFAVIHLEYDSFDNMVTEMNYGINNEPIITKAGYFMSTSEYSWEPKKDQYIITSSNFSIDGKPILREGIYFKMKAIFNQDGYFNAATYYGVNEQPVLYKTVDWERIGKLTADNNYLLGNIGFMHENGFNVKKDYQEAMCWYQKGAESGNAWSMLRLGDIYFNGFGVKPDYDEAIKWYLKAADAGNATSMETLGNIYCNGLGIKRDYTKATYWYTKGVDAGNNNAMYDLGYMYEFGDKPINDPRKALQWYQKGAKTGNSNSMLGIGRIYFQGLGVKQDNQKTFYWIDKAAKAGNTSAMGDLGTLYARGIGIKQDYAQAIYWLRKGAIDNTYAMNELGAMYQNGTGVKQDYSEAIQWYQKGAENGNANSMNSLGDIYYYGYGTKQNYPNALKWYQKGAEAGNNSAMNSLGWMYLNGNGVKQDYMEALKWFCKGIQAGSNSAINGLGWMYLNGFGIKQDYPEALKWFRIGAENGNSSAMSNLGWMYQNGYGVIQDSRQALEWYQKAADNGNQDAKKKLEDLKLKSTPINNAFLIVAGKVLPDSPAEKKGICKGDIILEYENWSLFSKQSFDKVAVDLYQTIAKYKNSAKHLKILRGNQIIDYQFPPGLMGISLEESKTSAKEVNRVRKIYEKLNH